MIKMAILYRPINQKLENTLVLHVNTCERSYIWTAEEDIKTWYDHRSLKLKPEKRKKKRNRLERDWNPLCDAGAVVFQVSDQANWELVILWLVNSSQWAWYLSWWSTTAPVVQSWWVRFPFNSGLNLFSGFNFPTTEVSCVFLMINHAFNPSGKLNNKLTIRFMID